MAPLTTSSVMVSLSLWVLWNCRPALYSWGLRGDKRPFNSERREVTEREALGEGYQSDIHHTNLSLGTGPAREGALEVVLSIHVWERVCVCTRLRGWGDGACIEWRLQGGRRTEEPVCSGVRTVTVQSGWGGERGRRDVPFICFHVLYICIHLCSTHSAQFTKPRHQDVDFLFFLLFSETQLPELKFASFLLSERNL